MDMGNAAFEQADRNAADMVTSATARAAKALEPNDAQECVVCGGTIPAARKRALPSADRCVACAGLRERAGR